MAFHAGQARALHVDRVREPNVSRLPRIHQPRRFVSGLDKVVDQGRLGLAFSNSFGVATGAFFHRRNSGKDAVLAKGVAFLAIRDAGFLRVCLVTNLEGWLPLHIEHQRENTPPGYQRGGKPESEDETVPAHVHPSTIQPRLEKKCWNKHTTCCRDNNWATPRTGEPPSQPGACVSWISCVSRACSSACHAAACGPETSPARVRPGTSQPSNSHPAP